jgi:hypothetical protein
MKYFPFLLIGYTFTRVATKQTYAFSLKTYCGWLDKTPNEIIDEAR